MLHDVGRTLLGMEARGITRRIGGPSVGGKEGQKRSITISGEEAE